jgi:cytochrome c oxidase assembly factor CtaG
MMLLHAGQPLAPHDLWRSWSVEPGVVIPLALTAVLYARGIIEFSRRATRTGAVVQREMLFVAAGFFVFTAALISPIHAAGGILFSAHMIQHELLMGIAAPLLVLGKPAVPLLFGLPESMRRPVGHAFSHGAIRKVWDNLTRPLAAFVLHAFAIWIWHAPILYDASVANSAVHGAQHISFIVTAILFWWSIFPAGHQVRPRGSAIIALFLTALHTTLLGALLTVPDAPMYSAYHDAITRAWGLTALEDQQLGGIIMWVPGGIVYLAAALYLMFKWLTASESRAKKRDAMRNAGLATAARSVAALTFIVMIASCSDHEEQWAASMTGGTPSRGKEAIRSYGCPACHTIPGIQGAKRLVGPPLSGIASRSYIAGVLSNTPTHMIEWLRNPPGIDSKTAMPNMDVTERDARDIAAYLYTLR